LFFHSYSHYIIPQKNLQTLSSSKGCNPISLVPSFRQKQTTSMQEQVETTQSKNKLSQP